MSLVTVLITIAVFLLLPGMVIDATAVRYAIKDIGAEYLWRVLNPINIIAMFVFGHAALSFSFYLILFARKTNKEQMFKNLEKRQNADSVYIVQALKWIFRQNRNKPND